jgi:modulator of FtsH protease
MANETLKTKAEVNALNMNVFETEQPRSSVEVNKLIRNTYTLLSMTLLFSAGMAGLAMVMNLPHPGFLISLIGFIGLFMLTAWLRNSAWGILAVFALTGFMGLTLGPVLNAYIHAFSNGHQLIIMAFGSTAVIFFGLSGYALTTKKDFSFMGAFLFAGLIVALLAMVGAWLFSMPGLALAVSAIMVLLMAGYILYDTSNIVHGHETNYIMATVALYVDIYVLFSHLLALFGALMGED